MSELHWKTGITKVEPNKILVRGYPVEELMGTVSFSQAIYLVLKGEIPSPEVGRMMDAILVSSIDHGASPPSVLAARTAASTGTPLNAALASGVLAISRYHGGAIEEAMKLFLKIGESWERAQGKPDEVIRKILLDMKREKKRASGYGHRLHTRDPRTERLFRLADELKLADKYVAIARSLESVLGQISGKSLPLNVDGAIAAVLCEMEFPPSIGNALFIIARMAGLTAHVQEEILRMKPMRKVHPQDFEYDGPEERKP